MLLATPGGNKVKVHMFKHRNLLVNVLLLYVDLLTNVVMVTRTPVCLWLSDQKAADALWNSYCLLCSNPSSVFMIFKITYSK